MEAAGDTYMSIAELDKGKKTAEAAYKAGIVYARAGLLEKAKQAWEVAAGQLNDRRYSSLATERLERIR